jgi:phosphoenolpyruvate carboxykinase (ATP)
MSLSQILKTHSSLFQDIAQPELIRHVLDQKEAIQTDTGSLATWGDPVSTGRSPADTFIVKRPEMEHKIDWKSSSFQAMTPDVFEELWAEAMRLLAQKKRLFVTHRVIGADASYALPVQTVSDRALTALFTENMFRDVPMGIEDSVFFDRAMEVVVLPWDKVKKGRCRPGGEIVIAMDFETNRALVLGCAYLGAVKKMLFTILNYLAPEKGILPLHASANIGSENDVAVLLGLSGTGKTTLSADPARALIGDDEHGWSDNGISNFENGCYAKLIDLNPKKEPEIYRISFEENDKNKGVIIENMMMYPNGQFDLSDRRLTENSRTSYAMSLLKNFEPTSQGGHPKTILFLTADANGVLPPVARLNKNQAMLWFLMGYTSKLAGTEMGITEPKSAFSRFFGEPFMPRNPEDYAQLLSKKIEQYGVQVYLVNTGWSGGPYGEGDRMDISVTRAIVEAAFSGALEKVSYEEDPRFHIQVPKTFPGVDSVLLQPKNTWKDQAAFEVRANKLAQDFSTYFDANFDQLSDEIRKECPGKTLKFQF